VKKGLLAAAVIVVAIISFLGVVLLVEYLDRLSALKHETSRWAVARDVNRDCIAVETSKDEVWNQLVELYQNKTRRWVGGIVEKYDNKWGFRFNPETVIVAEVTAEGLQATIKGISGNLDYWLGNYAYIGAEIVELHFP